MAKSTYTKEERKVQFLATGLKLARKNGITKLTAAAVAKEHKVTPPLVFHIFGSREGLQKAIKAEAKKKGVNLVEPKPTPAPKRKRTVAEVKAIKRKVTKAAAKKRPATTITQTVKVKAPKAKKFATVTPPASAEAVAQ